jgi:hypothetical protein
MTRIIYGRDTDSIEDFSQCVIIDIPNEVENIEDYLLDRDIDYGTSSQSIIGVDDLRIAIDHALYKALPDDADRVRVREALWNELEKM